MVSGCRVQTIERVDDDDDVPSKLLRESDNNLTDDKRCPGDACECPRSTFLFSGSESSFYVRLSAFIVVSETVDQQYFLFDSRLYRQTSFARRF